MLEHKGPELSLFVFYEWLGIGDISSWMQIMLSCIKVQ